MRIRILVPLLLIALGATAQGKKTVFSTMETNHIRVATPGLFSQRELIELPLEDIPDTEYSFPLPGGKVISPYGRAQVVHRMDMYRSNCALTDGGGDATVA